MFDSPKKSPYQTGTIGQMTFNTNDNKQSYGKFLNDKSEKLEQEIINLEKEISSVTKMQKNATNSRQSNSFEPNQLKKTINDLQELIIELKKKDNPKLYKHMCHLEIVQKQLEQRQKFLDQFQ